MAARGAVLRGAVGASLLALAAGAHPEGFNAALEPTFTLTTLQTRDQLGTTTRQESRQFGQSYRLGYDLTLGPSLFFTAGAMLDDRRSRSDAGAGWTSNESTTRALYGRFNLALPAITGGLGYDLAQTLATEATTQTNESYSVFARWFPLDLPDLSLRLGRVHQYDRSREAVDLTTTSALVSAVYRHDVWEAKYVLVWSRPSDAVTGTVSSAVDQVAQGIYSDRLFAGRTALYATATLRNQTVRTLETGIGDITVQQHPLAGLSFIEAFPALPETDTLAPNPALVDGNLTAGAALDIGFGPTVAGDTNRRDAGVQFADLLTSVNTIRVWVDKKLPAIVTGAYAWTVYRSDDNKSWIPVPVTRPVTFAPFQNYFEIPILESRARYLKVVTQPLQAAVTTEPIYSSVLITEVQVFEVNPASEVPSVLATSGASLYATATTRLWSPANLSWDLAASLERRITPTNTLWNLSNGLTASQTLTRTLQISERVARLDGDFGLGRTGQTDWSAGLTWKPLRTFFGSLSYAGQYIDAQPTLDVATGTYYTAVGGRTNTVASLARADLYEGISAQANATGGVRNQPGVDTWSGSFNATTALTPNPYATLSLGWLSSYSAVISQETGRTGTNSERMDATLSLRPAGALSLIVSVSRTLAKPKPYNTGTAQLSFSPFRGELQLSLGYSRSFETATRTSTELFTSALRWYVRPGVQASASYTLLNSSTPVSESRTRSLGVGLTVNL